MRYRAPARSKQNAAACDDADHKVNAVAHRHARSLALMFLHRAVLHRRKDLFRVVISPLPNIARVPSSNQEVVQTMGFIPAHSDLAEGWVKGGGLEGCKDGSVDAARLAEGSSSEARDGGEQQSQTPRALVKVSRGVWLQRREPDDYLLSHGQSALSLAWSRFTVLFGMGRGGTDSLWSSGKGVVPPRSRATTPIWKKFSS